MTEAWCGHACNFKLVVNSCKIQAQASSNSNSTKIDSNKIAALSLFLLACNRQIFFQRCDHRRSLGWGALISSVRPASSTALEVLLPKAPILVPFCLNLRKVIKKASYTAGREKTNDIVFAVAQHILYIIADGAVHERRGKPAIVVFSASPRSHYPAGSRNRDREISRSPCAC